MMIKRKTEKGIKTLRFNDKTTDNALAYSEIFTP